MRFGPVKGFVCGAVSAVLFTGVAVTVQIELVRAASETSDAEDTSNAEEAFEESDHWSFQRPVRSLPPDVENVDWVQSPIDSFVLHQLEAAGVKPAEQADRVTLMRRLYLDLIGLPPEPAHVENFLLDDAPDAYERLAARLLDSPHFGERWGRHWLDLARYADSDGYEKDGFRPQAWRFRKWVVDAINADMPFDQFTVEQLAGDLLENPSRDQLIATGFHRQTLINTEGGVDQEEFRIKANSDRVITTGTVWLGLTMLCTQCHDHKYDPLSMRDFYQVQAFFNDADDAIYNFPTKGATADDFHAKLKKHNADISEIEKQIEKARAEMADPTGRLNKLVNQLMRKQRQGPQSPAGAAMVMTERETPRTSRILLRGDFMQPGEEVLPGTIRVLNSFKPRRQRANRLDLAHWLVDPENPLTARVSVNRIWRNLFGRGIVSSVDDFGVMGEEPTHPELLDWLATEYIRLGWSRKSIIRTIVTSSTYRQSSRTRAELAEDDPENELLARQQRFRVEAEIVRDLYLATSGLLYGKMGGPNIRPLLPPSVAEVSYASSIKWKTSAGFERHRRGVYITFQRTIPYPSLMAFDCPDGVVTAPGRNRSNTPLQSLTLLNDPVFFEATQAMGRRVLEASRRNDQKRLAYAARLALSRSLSDEEFARLEYLLEKQRERFSGDLQAAKAYCGPAANGGGDERPAEVAAWIGVCSVLMNLDEFMTRE